MIDLGLSWWQGTPIIRDVHFPTAQFSFCSAWICVWVGYGVVAPFIVANARPGAVFHITFPVVARTSFGVWGSLWCVFNRGAMAWYAHVLPICLDAHSLF
jgi:cytosine/uracil/thiamine/allantoin permease